MPEKGDDGGQANFRGSVEVRHPDPPVSRRPSSPTTVGGGLSRVEMALVAAMARSSVMAITVAVTAPAAERVELRYKLSRCQIHRQVQAYCDDGPAQPGVDSECYPPDLESLVEGVDLIGQVNKKMKFLRRIPMDPIRKKAEWGLRSFQDDPTSSSWGGQNVYDVYSLSDRRAIDKTSYKDW